MKAALNKFVRVSALVFSLSSCSLHYTTAEGINRHVGFMIIDSTENKCQLMQSIETFGIGVDLTNESGGLNIGRKIVTTTSIPSDSLISFESAAVNDIRIKEYNITLQRDRPKAALLTCP